MQHPAFAAPGRFWRGNLHTHSDLSDGALPPAEVCRAYEAAGYDFICLSDHLVGRYGYPISDTVGFRTNRFTTILGAEMHNGSLANGEIWHVLAVGLPADFERPETPDFDSTDTGEGMARLVERASDAGAFVALAHPEWYGLTPEDARTIARADAVEIYNHGCATAAARGSGIALWDQLLNEGRRLVACATDDAHFRDGQDHFGGWVMVKAEANEPAALLAALKAGAFYSSTGPELRDVRIEGEAVVVDCSPVERIVAMGPRSTAAAAFGPSITRAEIPLGRMADAPWIRVAVEDAAGRRAWSNPVWRGFHARET